MPGSSGVHHALQVIGQRARYSAANKWDLKNHNQHEVLGIMRFAGRNIPIQIGQKEDKRKLESKVALEYAVSLRR